jgi:hypothetical protein
VSYAVEVRFDPFKPPVAYDENGEQCELPEWAMHAWVSGHEVRFAGDEEFTCAVCPWPEVPVVNTCPTCLGTGVVR